MTDVFELVGKVSLNGVDDVNDEIGKMGDGFTVLKGTIANLIGEGITKLGQAITENLGGAIDRVDTIASFNRTMVNLGYSAEDTVEATNKLKEGILGLPTTLPTILTTQQQFSALLGNLDQATNLTLALNDATLSGGQGQEIANSALTQWYQIIANGTPDLMSWRIINSAMPAQLNMIAEACIGSGAKAQDLYSAWQEGTVTTEQVIDALIQLDNEGSSSLADFHTQALDSSSGINTSMTNVKTAIKTALGEIITAINGDDNRISGFFDKIKQVIKTVQPVLVDFTNKAIEKIQEFVQWLEENKDKVELLADAIVVLVGAWGGFKLGTVLQGMVKGFQDAKLQLALYKGTMTNASIAQGILNGQLTLGEGIVALLTGKMTLAEFAQLGMAKAQAVLNAVMSANPIALIVMAIVALIAIIVVLWNKCEWFRNLVTKLWDWLKETFTNVAEVVKTKASELFTWLSEKVSEITEWLSQAFENVKGFFSNLIEGIKQFISDAHDWITQKLKAISDFFTNIIEGIKSTVQAVHDWFTETLQSIADFFTNTWDSITTFLSETWETIKNIVEVGGMFLEEIINLVLDLIVGFFRENFGEQIEIVVNAWNSIKQWVSDTLTVIHEFIVQKLQEISEWWNTTWTAISDFVNSIFTAISEFISTTLEAIKQVWEEVWTAISEWFNQTIETIKTFIEEQFTLIKDKIEEIWTAVKDKITEIWNNIKTTISNTIEEIKTAVTNKFNEIKQNITNKVNETKEKISEIWNNIKTFISTAVDNIKTDVANKFNETKEKIVTPLNQAKETVSNIFDNIKDGIKQKIESARDTVKSAIDKIKSFFNFTWSLPHLKMPHVSISGSFSLMPPSVPHFSVDWYKQGGILTDPTIFGLGKNGNLLGGGEAGAEAVAPIDTLMDYVRVAVDESNGELAERLNGVVSLLSDYLPQLTQRQLILDTGVLVGELASPMDESLGTIQRRKDR